MNFKKNILKKEIEYEVLILPALILYTLFCLYPFFSTFYYSVTNYSDINIKNLKFIGIGNFIKVLNNDMLVAAIKNSLIYAILLTFFQSFFAIPLAVALDRNLKTRNLLRTIFFMPAVFSTLIVGYLWNYIYSPSEFGLINNLLNSIGISKVNFLGNGDIAIYSVVATQVWQWTGWAMVIYLANIQSISKEYYEAAEMDGASAWVAFWKITLPMLNPAFTMVTVTSMIGGLKVFDIIFALTQGGPGYSTETIMTAMIKKGFGEGFYGVAAAFGVLFFIIVMLITFLMMKLLSKWEAKLK